MLKKIVKKFRKLNNNVKSCYISYLDCSIDDKLVLLEGGQGTNINGNMFSMLNELNSNKRWQDYKTVFVVTEDTIKKAEERMKFYGFDKVILSVRNSNEYCKYLATAKYLLTDNSFPPYFSKRSEQVFLNTWHGTPLKTLGKSDKSNLASLANIQKNYLMSDYALFPNEFTRNVFMEDYDLKHIFKGNSLIANYPRNYIFYNNEQPADMKKRLGYEGKKLFAYMPTWRGTGRTADTKYQLDCTNDILKKLDKKLDDDTVLLVNLHFLLASGINCDKFKHIDYFPSSYDTYEILNACDGLITDYSSVFFDYAVTGKKVILYAYDKEKYLSSRGVYIPFESLPFPIVETVDDVVREMNTPATVDAGFVNEYCPNGYINSCELLFELMVTGKSDYFKLEKNNTDKLCLIYAGNMPDSSFEPIKEYINQNPGFNYVIAYRKNLTKSKKEFILSLDSSISTLGTVTAIQYKPLELLRVAFCKLFGLNKGITRLNALALREKDRLFYSIEPDRIVDFSCENIYLAMALAKMSGEKQYINHGDAIAYSPKNKRLVNAIRAFERENGFEELDFSADVKKLFIENNEDGLADESYRKASSMKNIMPLYMKCGNKMICLSLFKLTAPSPVKFKDTFITVGDKEYKHKSFSLSLKGGRRHIGVYKFTVPVEDVIDMPATNKVALNYKNPLGYQVQCHIVYNALLLRFFLGLHGPFTLESSTSSVAIFRQSRANRLNIYVRSYNVSDATGKRISQVIAFILSKLWYGKKAKGLVLLFEKNSAKYEESASVTFEKLIDSGYKYAYFIVTKDALCDVPEKYRKNALIKHSFKHYLYFFKAKTFIGTETMVHAIDLKTFNRLALMKVASPNKNYVFLQHGVMYMVSLDSEARGMFKRKKLNGKYRVVVSSQAEADHFAELGNHLYEDLYICGLPKFDKSYLNDDADKIVIMPTWRPWEINTARDNFLETDYFKMMMKIYDNVPDKYKDKVIILPHPLIMNELKNLPESVSDRIMTDVCYDEILRQARVLITDYSSIAYDAFYRGTRVIFYWEEKDFCMSQYGPSTKLMLNEDNVYGDYFYNTDGLTQAIELNYNNPQREDYIDKYRKIVTYHDGKNTDRLIKFLKKDNIIKM